MAEKSNKVLLQVKGLKVAYGGIQAVKGVTLKCAKASWSR